MYLLVVHVANAITAWMNAALWVPVEHGINNLVPPGFWNDFLIGDYGILSRTSRPKTYKEVGNCTGRKLI